ncbi:MAG: hypothetical protein ACR2QT_07375 [Woeseiaceae bacterium]
MFRVLISIGIGAVFGGLIANHLVDRTPTAVQAPITATAIHPIGRPNPITIDVQPIVSTQVFRSPTVNQLVALPSVFEKKRALYELASSATPASLQEYIFDADLLARRRDRQIALLILFERLTEFDPQSALALAQTDMFVADKIVLKKVWKTWAEADLEAALRVATQLDHTFERDLAIQAMLSAHGHMGNPTTQRISAVTGVEANRENRIQFLYQLADELPASAFEYVNKMQSKRHQSEAIPFLARHLLQSHGGVAIEFANSFANTEHKNQYVSALIIKLAESDPQSALKILNTTENSSKRNELFDRVFRRIMAKDVYAAKHLADQINDPRIRDYAYYRVIRSHRDNDPVEAAGWTSLISDREIRGYAQRLTKRSLAAH